MVDVAGNVGGAVSPVLQVAKWLAGPIWRQFKYLYNYKSNFDKLQEQVDKLKNAGDEVQRKVTAAEKNVEEIKQNVKDWQEGVDKMIIEAEQLIEEKANNPRCFKGLCPNFIIHYKQSKKAFKLKQNNIDPLLQQGKELDPVSNPTNPREIWLRSSEDYLAFESRNCTVKNVWDALNDENVFMIGVYGMGGLGKTTLVQELGRKAEKEKLFEEIVFVEVSESPDIKKIQTTIGEKLKLKFENESEMANKIYSRMEKKNILLILDNIWKPLKLDTTVGIPREADRGRNKILFTSRNVDVLEQIGSTKNFGMGFLNDDEAWRLFTKMAGNVIQTRELHSLANEVCKECKGLPIVICTIAKTLKNKSHLSDWRVALQELRAPTPTKFVGLLEEEYTKIALSYNYLSNELKKTFLISSLLENNTSISELFKHVVCLDILEGANLTMGEARDRLDKLVHDLKDACLLLNGFESNEFAMHDVVRAVAITIAYVDHDVFTQRNDVEREWKDRDKLKKCTKISLPGNSLIISQLRPNYFDCPTLEYLNMTSTWESSFIFQEDIFMVMPNLKVMNLVGLKQSSLSSSIGLLTNLQSLCLKYSRVENFAIIGKLKTLKVLSLQSSIIEEFPIEFGQLIQLRLLDLNHCWKLKVVAPKVISQLSKLEEFYIKRCPIKWKHEVLEEVKSLSRLTILELDVKDTNVFPKDFLSKELKRYKISIGQRIPHLEYVQLECEYGQLECILQLKFNSDICIEKLCGFNNVKVLELDGSLYKENDIEASKVISQSNETRPFFNKKVIFTGLMKLKLSYIPFGKIWESQLSTFSYENLTKLILHNCYKIKYVFPFFITKSLQQLQYLEIKHCVVLEKIIEEEEEDGTEVVDYIFPHITQLILQNLPKLTIFYQEPYALELPLLKWLEIDGCPNFTLRYESFQDNKEGEVQVSASRSSCLEYKSNFDLEAIRVYDDWRRPGPSRKIDWWSESETLDISRANISVGLFKSFYNLEVLKISYCDGWIKRLMTTSMAKSLAQVREMSIIGCILLTEIIENKGDETTTEIVFNNLNKLSLERLDNLNCFCSGNCSFNFPSLEELIIKDCPNMKTFSSGNLIMPKLRNARYSMSWRNEEKLEEIRENDLNTTIQEAYEKEVNLDLTELTLSGSGIMSIRQGEYKENFDKVETLALIEDEYAYIPIQTLIKFISLKQLELKVSAYEEIFSCEEVEELGGAFAELKVLHLEGLYNLKCIWKQDFRFKSILQNLYYLNVEYCHNLMTLLPPSLSFENLTTLTVYKCNRMQNLIASSTAKSLVWLKDLEIEKCEMMIEVLANEEDKEKDEIVFEELKVLTLVELESLTCFCSGNYVLNFPSLETLDVSDCSKMKTFSKESVKMPKLQMVNGKVCTDDISSVIQQLQNNCSEFCDRMAKEFEE